MKRISLLAIGTTTVILIIILAIVVTVEVKISTNETCTVSITVNEYPAPWQYPIGNASTCCTTFSFTSPLGSYASATTESGSFGNIVTITGTATITNSGVPGVEWDETICTYTG
jgi:hypothetical protein